MSNINDKSLVFTIPDETIENKMVICQIPMENIIKWMTSVYPHADKHREIQDHYINLAIRHGILNNEAAIDFSYEHGMNRDLQALMMEVVIDLKNTLGIEDFLELWELETDDEDDKYIETQSWAGLDDDGSTFTTESHTNQTKH